MTANGSLTVAITVFLDQRPIITDWHTGLWMSQPYWRESKTLPTLSGHAADLHRLDMMSTMSHTSPLGEPWSVFSIRPEYNTNQLGAWKPVNLYCEPSEHWSAMVHFPLAAGFGECVNRYQPPKVISYAFRASST